MGRRPGAAGAGGATGRAGRWGACTLGGAAGRARWRVTGGATRVGRGDRHDAGRAVGWAKGAWGGEGGTDGADAGRRLRGDMRSRPLVRGTDRLRQGRVGPRLRGGDGDSIVRRAPARVVPPFPSRPRVTRPALPAPAPFAQPTALPVPPLSVAPHPGCPTRVAPSRTSRCAPQRTRPPTARPSRRPTRPCSTGSSTLQSRPPRLTASSEFPLPTP